ncbi:hypothetical protein SCAR479_04296 [Seiridium cardinale]|uniref:Uncharacterized protein n=1 Tax=Seiridium cardinale TaxID=138064 RepID=A0ABR2XXX6_9PEZI
MKTPETASAPGDFKVKQINTNTPEMASTSASASKGKQVNISEMAGTSGGPSSSMNKSQIRNAGPSTRQNPTALISSNNPALPGCSMNKMDTETVTLTNEMLQAYNAMRGPGGGFGTDLDDPLIDLMLQPKNMKLPSRKGKERERKIGQKYAGELITDVDRTLDSDLSSEDDEPRSFFVELKRPQGEHIPLFPGIDLSMHKLSAAGADFKVQEDDSDEEEQRHQGRISPCEFLRLADGCQPWNKSQPEKIKTEVALVRSRPKSPELCDTPPPIPRSDRWQKTARYQICRDTGRPMTPHYPVPSNPSVVWVAEGIDTNRMYWKSRFEDDYARMDPSAAKKLRQLKQFGRVYSEPETPAGKDEPYSKSEVDKIIAEEVIEGRTDNVDIQGVNTQLRRRYAVIHAQEAESKQLESSIRQQTDRIRELESEKHTVKIAVWNLKKKRAEEETRKKLQDEEKKRRQHILDRYRAYLEEIEYQSFRGQAILDQERAEKAQQDELIRKLEEDIREACQEVGKLDPDGVYEELAEGDVPYRVRDPSEETSHGVQFGSDYTDSLAKPSPLRLQRARSNLAAEAHRQQAKSAQSKESQTTQIHVPIPRRLVHARFFYPQSDFDPYDMGGNSSPRSNFGNPSVEATATGNTTREARQDSPYPEPDMDVYDDQGFPISPGDSASNAPTNCAPGYNDAHGKTNRTPVMAFQEMVPTQAQINDGESDFTFYSGTDVSSTHGMYAPPQGSMAQHVGQTEQRNPLGRSPTPSESDIDGSFGLGGNVVPAYGSTSQHVVQADQQDQLFVPRIHKCREELERESIAAPHELGVEEKDPAE